MTATYQDLIEEADIEQEIEKLTRTDLRSADAGAPTTWKDASDPDERVTVYSTLTGEPRLVPVFALPKTMRKRLPNGKRAFSPQPTRPWKQGDVPCYLNEKHPRFDECVGLGIVSVACPAEHLASLYSQRIHMQNRHRQEWATIQENDNQLREQEYRDAQKWQAEAARMAVQGKPAKGGA